MDKAKDDPIGFVKMVLTQMKMSRQFHIQDYEDLVSEGLVGLADAHSKFRPEDGNKFSTYAEFRVKGAIKDYLRTMNGRHGQKAGLVTLLNSGDDDSRSIEDMAVSEYRDPVDRMILEEGFSKLSERDKIIAVMDAEGCGEAEMAEELGISKSRVSQIKTNYNERRRGRRRGMGKVRDPEIVERQRKVFELMDAEPNLTQKEIALRLGLKPVTVSNDIIYRRRKEGFYKPKQKFEFKHTHEPVKKTESKVEFSNFRDEVVHILQKNNVPQPRIMIILGLIDL